MVDGLLFFNAADTKKYKTYKCQMLNFVNVIVVAFFLLSVCALETWQLFITPA